MRNISLLDIILFAGTRVALGIGIGFLVSGRLNRDQRRAAGLALALVGGLSTPPMMIGFRRKLSAVDRELNRAA